MFQSKSNLRVGVYVDVEYLRYSGGYSIRYDTLRSFAARDGGELMHLNSYQTLDHEQVAQDQEYLKRFMLYQMAGRESGWKMYQHNAPGRGTDKSDHGYSSIADIQMVTDIMMNADRLDLVLLVTGYAHFVPVVTGLQAKGLRVELLGFKNVSEQLLRQVDYYYSGYLIPNLLPISYEPRNEWGVAGSCVRGVCTKWFPEKGYGFLKVMKEISPHYWLDPRDSRSPYISVFCHVNEIADEVTDDLLLDRNTVLEFYLQESQQKDDGLVANNVRLAFNQR